MNALCPSSPSTFKTPGRMTRKNYLFHNCSRMPFRLFKHQSPLSLCLTAAVRKLHTTTSTPSSLPTWCLSKRFWTWARPQDTRHGEGLDPGQRAEGITRFTEGFKKVNIHNTGMSLCCSYVKCYCVKISFNYRITNNAYLLFYFLWAEKQLHPMLYQKWNKFLNSVKGLFLWTVGG